MAERAIFAPPALGLLLRVPQRVAVEVAALALLGWGPCHCLALHWPGRLLRVLRLRLARLPAVLTGLSLLLHAPDHADDEARLSTHTRTRTHTHTRTLALIFFIFFSLDVRGGVTEKNKTKETPRGIDTWFIYRVRDIGGEKT